MRTYYGKNNDIVPTSKYCPLCNLTYRSDHLLSCCKCQALTTRLHNQVCVGIANLFLQKRKAVAEPKKLGEHNNAQLSDGTFRDSDGHTHHFDVSFTSAAKDMQNRYEKKAAKFTNSDFGEINPDSRMFPIIFSYDGQIHPRSLYELAEVAPEITAAQISRVVLISLCKARNGAQAELARALNRKQGKKYTLAGELDTGFNHRKDFDTREV